MKKHNKGKIYYSFLTLSILPLLIFGIIIIFSSTYFFSRAMHKEVAAGLETSAALCSSLLDSAYPGDYKLVESQVDGKTAYSLYKGDIDITMKNNILNNLKAETGMDFTLFYQNTRVLTTITKPNGESIIGTAVSDNVVKDVLHTGNPMFYDEVIINYTSYFAYYIPLTNSDGSVVGMLFIGKSSEEVNSMVNTTILPTIIIGVIAMLITGFISFFYSERIVSTLQKLKEFFLKISSGDLNVTPAKSILKRGDEFSEIGYAALAMQRSLKTLIERDALTELYNRRSCDKKLRKLIIESQKENKPFALAIADIDHFKNINDTYGHDSGDIVLQNVAKILKAHIHKQGFVGRWGGEEFLLVYEDCNLTNAKEQLALLQNTLRDTTHTVDEHRIQVTMTFGLVCDASLDMHELITKADKHLYTGKTNGRDCIVS